MRLWKRRASSDTDDPAERPEAARPPNALHLLFGTGAPDTSRQMPASLTASPGPVPEVADPVPEAAALEAQIQTPATAVVTETRPPEPTTITVTVPHPNDEYFRTPNDLEATELPVKRALIIGSCFSGLVQAYLGHAFRGIQTDFILYNHAAALPQTPPRPLEEYGLQIILLPLRTPMPEHLYFGLGYDDVAGHEAAFREARERLVQMLHGALGYRDRLALLTFVSNFTVPQQNLMGRLLPRYDLRNPVYFIEQLNRVIADEIAGMANVYLLDTDQISANFGRKYIQDDVIWLFNHQGVINDFDVQFDRDRIEPARSILHEHVERVQEFIIALCLELRAMHRTVSQADMVKLVIVYLDDTLWRGVVSEHGIDRPMVTEGWPIGLVEALIFLKKRGVLLAVVSKNDEARIRALWPSLYGGRLELSDFASVKINFLPKADNVERILQEMNLLPRSVVFIDDNPVERENVVTAFPGIRVLGKSPYVVRRILLWAPETQTASISGESARRTEMVQAQVAREGARSRLTRAEFLDSLEVVIRLYAISGTGDPRFARALELINKSNQFNTTGRRWALNECQAAFAGGAIFWAFEVDDRFTKYGVVGVAVLQAGDIRQFVMSCRVVGLEVEIAVISALLAGLADEVRAHLEPTDANLLCRDLFARCGFTEAGTVWHRPASPALPCPVHVRSVTRHEAMAALV